MGTLVPHKMAGFVLAILACVSLVQGNVFTVDLAQLAVERLDPIVFNGMSPEGHVHTISGGDGFSKTGSFGELVGSSCTTGNVKKDLSNDCCQTTPPGGTNPIVPGSIRSFPDGFKMIAGGPGATGPWNGGGIVNHKCMGPYIDTPDFPANPEQCTGGIRAEVSFPSCWDGVNLDSEHHNTHVSYRVGGHWEGGECPSSHPVMMPT